MALGIGSRAAMAGTIAALGLSAATWSGDALLGGVIALISGAFAVAILTIGRESPGPAAPAATEGPALPALDALMDAVDEPLLVVRDRRVTIANHAARALLGAHIEGSDVRLAIRHPAAAERLGDGPAVDQVSVRTELDGIGELGRPWEMIVTGLPDGSRLVRLADQSAARAAEQMRVDFVANASHELRTPLATLLGFLETLQDEAAGGDAATRARFITIMFGEATRMRDLLDDLMSLSRIEADRFAAPRDSVDLLSLIEEVKHGLKAMARDRALVVENGAGAVTVAGDRRQLAQMLNNLLVNALKYGRAGTPVQIALEPAGAELVRIAIVDEGEGIAAEHIPRLTERFYRVDPGRSRSVGGTGLGLAIVKHIILRHRGRLEIQSRPGEGTIVNVTLPRAGALSS
jgi:two-component system phosphate regulon sensor histidine kinase PhoR